MYNEATALFIGQIASFKKVLVKSTTPDAKTVGRLRVAANTTRVRDGVRRKRTTWMTVIIWSENLTTYIADNSPIGRRVFIKGELTSSQFQKDGKEVERHEISIGPGDVIRFMDSGEQQEGGHPG